MKHSSLSLSALFLFALLQIPASAQQFSKNGHTVPVKGTIKVLLVFAEVTGTGSPNLSPNWPVEGDIPINAGEYFDAELPASGIPEKRLSRLLWEASFGQYLVLGDYLETVVSVNQTQLSGNGITNVLNELDVRINSSTIQFGNPITALQDFDLFDIARSTTDYRKGELKPNTPNTKIDVIIILWRNHPSFGCNAGLAVQPFIDFVNSPFGSFSGVENIGNFGGCFSDILTIDFVMQEYFHAMFGGNNWHAGSGGGRHTFQSHTNGWGLCTQSQGVGMSNVVSGWDRNHLEWEHPGKNQTDGIFISVGDQNIGEAPSDISIQSHPGGATFLLRDFVTTGDAVRIKLPHLQDDGNTTVKNQFKHLDRGTSPTRHIKPEVINGQNVFTDPTVFTCLDGSVFNVESGATVLVDNGSTLRLRSGSRLEVQSNATLIVDNGSRLELEDGSELTVRSGGSVVIRQAGGSTLVFGSNTGSDPVIRLLGPDALLDIAGNLHITDNKNFTFSGSGFVRFSATNFPSRNITAGANASMTFTGSGQNDLVLEVQQETLYGPEKLSFFTVTDAKVSMHPGATDE